MRNKQLYIKSDENTSLFIRKTKKDLFFIPLTYFIHLNRLLFVKVKLIVYGELNESFILTVNE